MREGRGNGASGSEPTAPPSAAKSKLGMGPIIAIAIVVIIIISSLVYFLNTENGEPEENIINDDEVIIEMTVEEWNAEYDAYGENIEATGVADFPSLNRSDTVKISGIITDIQVIPMSSGDIYTRVELDGHETSHLYFALNLTGYAVNDSVTITVTIDVIYADGKYGEIVKEMFGNSSGRLGLSASEISKN